MSEMWEIILEATEIDCPDRAHKGNEIYNCSHADHPDYDFTEMPSDDYYPICSKEKCPIRKD